MKGNVAVLYEDGDYVIVNKPYDMYINSDDATEKNTVAHHISSVDCHLSTSRAPVHFVHRLDYATSGVLCIAKNKSSAAAAGRLLERRLARKYYLAVVRGHVAHEALDILYQIGEDVRTDSTNHMMVAVTSPHCVSVSRRCRSAATRMLVLERGYYSGDPATIVLMKPTTGRRHQLRAHCSAVQHTILGDYTYSEAADRDPHRMFLHATRLVLPFENKPLDIQTEDPFNTDDVFNSKWRSDTGVYSFSTKQELRSLCDVIDNVAVSVTAEYNNMSAVS